MKNGLGIVKCIVFSTAISILYGMIGHPNHKSAVKCKAMHSTLSRFRPL